MKIEQLLVQHFYNTREVTLQGIGTFILSPDFILPGENEKDLVMPENAISFTYNARAAEDEALIGYIVQQTRKIKPLAAADLDSYLVLGKQFLNIGKPFRIEGLGKLEKNQLGQYEFTQGNFSGSKKETPAPLSLREKDSEDDISFAAKARQSAIPKKGLLIAAVALTIIMLSAVSWYFFIRKKPATEQSALQTPVAQNDTVTQNDLVDTTLNKKITVSAPPKDAYSFKIVFKETNNKAIAVDKMNNMVARGHKVIMYTSDSVNYKLAEPFNLPLGDTTRIKDSLNKYYYLGKAYVELN